MKTLLAFLIVLLLGIDNVTAQTPFEPPSIRRLNAMLHSQSKDTISFTDTSIFIADPGEFILGHQWYTAKVGVNKRLWMNTFNEKFFYEGLRDAYFPTFPRTTGKQTYISWTLEHGIEGWGGLALSLQFDPEAPSTEPDGLFVPTSNDTTGALFGFGLKRGGYRGGDSFSNRYVYTVDSVPSGDTGVVILSKPAAVKSLTRSDRGGDGRRWYVAINLRRSDAVWNDSTTSNDTVLTIKLPYIYRRQTGLLIDTLKKNIRFDSVSAFHGDTLDTVYNSRSRWMDNLLVTLDTTIADTIFAIRRSMLPKYSDSCDITLSAFFRANDSINHFFRAGAVVQIGEIDTFDMEVRYFGKCNIAIDWIRMEVPEARKLFRGGWDSTAAAGLSRAYKYIREYKDSLPGIRLWRFYGNDEPSPLYWRAHRYYSFLVEHNFHCEGAMGNHYSHITPQKSYWGGAPHLYAGDPVPFAKFGNSANWYRAGSEGYNYGDNSMLSFDYLTGGQNQDGSAYETNSYIGHGGTLLGYERVTCSTVGSVAGGTTFEDKWKILTTTSPGPLNKFDNGMYYGYLNSAFLYSGKPWISNVWVLSEWQPVWYSPGHSDLIIQWYRPQTGEEHRLSSWLMIILGAKGLMYDRFTYDYELTDLQSTDTVRTRKGWYGVTSGYVGISPDVINNDTSGNFLLHSEASGSDWVHRGDYSKIAQYVNLDTVAKYLGVDTNHVYVGAKSTRLEVLKIHDYIHGVSNTLMRLQLMSWYGKGHRELVSMKNNDTTLLTKYLWIDSSHVKTRPIQRSYADGWDTTFCDFTIHKDTSISMDSIFFIGVLNRRTNPLIRPIGDTLLRFYSTTEFDSLTLEGDSLWRTQRYNQGGSREICIPFNYHSTHGYALLRIRELGGGIDTVIGQDRPLAVKFLPGEGKMFKVEILHPDTTIAGNLSYTNQRKLVGFPKLGDSDSMYYHLTYHKPIPGSSPSRSAVYYRRSEAMRTNSSTQNIIWQKEILVSKSIRLRKGQNDTIASSNCAYPSLVVRYDNSSLTNKVFVVYSCEDEDTCFYSKRKRIVETILPADDSSQSFNWPLKAETLSTFYGSLDEYGTPMINASDSGNYYCWADSLLGIVAGWKHTDSTYLEDTKNISYRISIAELPTGCKHPSMNSYSRLNLGENDCALVWQEKFYSGDNMDKSRILYTRLQMINGFLTHYLPPTLSSGNGIQVLGLAGNIAELSNYGGEANTNYYLPSVYREIADSVYSTTTQQRDVHVDCAAWHSFGVPSGTPTGAVHRRRLSLLDTNGVANTWSSDGLSRVRASSAYLNNVSLSQGDAYLDVIASYPSGGYVYNGSSRSHIMTFTESPVYTFGGSPPYRKLWQIQSNSYFAPSFHDTSLSAFQSTSKAFVIDNDGAVGQTAALPRMNTQEEWRKNRRVYEGVTDGSLRRIQASAEYFLKQTASSDIEPSIFSGFHDGESTYMLSNPILNGQMLSLERVKRLRGEAGKFGGRHGFTDTLETNWFTVGDEANLMLKSIGKNADLVSAFVERRSDGERFTVQLRTSDDTTALWTRIPLLRGGVEEYKFFMVKNSVGRGEESFTIPDYGEEMVLGEMKTSISFNKGNNDIQAIDLGRKAGTQASIRVFPNPAQDKVSVVVLGNNPKDVWHIKVMNVLGDVMSEYDDKTSSLLEIVTEDYPSGVYYITAESGKLNATARFVIMK